MVADSVGLIDGRGSPCRAPWVSMHLDPLGNVRACEENSLHMLGNVGESTLREIWHGRAADRLRTSLAARDLSLGCEGCAWQIRAGDPHLAHARAYDGFGMSAVASTWPKQLELSLSNTCNLQCVQCSGELSSAIRAKREKRPPLPQVYDERFFTDLAEFLPHVEQLVMIGGEPFLGREPLRVFDMLIDAGLSPICILSTNGTVWNERVERILDSLPVHVSISMDGSTSELYESIRVGADLASTLANLDRFQDRAEARGTPLNLNYCFMMQNAHDLAPFLLMAERRSLPVHVMTVTYPAHFSLFRLPAPQLEAVIAGLEAQEPELGDLVLNRAVWDDQLARLRHHLTSIGFADVPVSVGGLDADQIAASVAQKLGDGGPLHYLDAIDSEIVVGIGPEPADVFGMDLRPLIGRHMSGIMAHLVARFGEVRHTDLVHLGHGVEQRSLELDGGEGPTTVFGILATNVAERTDRWYFSRAPASPPAP